MNNQESMFETPERAPRHEHLYNADPREQYEQAQWEERLGEESYEEGYAEREGPYTDGRMRQIGDGKIRPQRPRSKGMNWIIALAVGVPLLFFIALGGIGLAFGRMERGVEWGNRGQYGWDKGPHNWDMKGRSSEPTSINVGAQPTLVINDANGTVHIHTGDAGQVVVSSQGANDAQGGFGGVQPLYDPQSNVITINAQSQPGPGSGFSQNNNSADLEITAPANSNIQVQTDTGDVEVDGINGQLTLNSNSGTIVANDVSGQMIVNAGSGDISVRGKLQGQSALKTGNGVINFNGTIDAQGSYLIETVSGDVNLSLPDNSSFSLSTKTNSGTMNNEFRDTHIGASPQPQLSINTDSGSINLRRER